jgi:hypothetical protein
LSHCGRRKVLSTSQRGSRKISHGRARPTEPPISLLSVTGPYVAEKSTFARQARSPGLAQDPVAEADRLPGVREMTADLRSRVDAGDGPGGGHQPDHRAGLTTITGKPVASLTVVLYGSSRDVRLSTLLTPRIEGVHPAKVSTVTDTTAVPGRGEFAVTLPVTADILHLTPTVVPGLTNVAVVPAFSPASPPRAPVGAENAWHVGVCAEEAVGSVPARGGWWPVSTRAAVR